MALSKNATLDKIEIDLTTGNVSIRENTEIFDGTELVANKFHRTSYVPGDDITALPNKLQRWINHIWANL